MANALGLADEKARRAAIKTGAAMLERLLAEISLLASQMENEPKDKHELYLQLREKLNEMKATGMPLPKDLVRLEHRLEAEFRGETKPL